LKTSPSLPKNGFPSPEFIQPAPSISFTSGTIPLPSPRSEDQSTPKAQSPIDLPSESKNETEPSFFPEKRRPSLTPSLSDRSPQSTPPRTHKNSPGAKNYFPLVTSPSSSSKARSPTPLDSESRNLPRDGEPFLSPSTSRSSIFPTVKPPSARPTPSNVFPLVKSPSSNSTGKMSSNPFPFADPPLSPVPHQHQQQRRPSVALSTTSSKSAGSSSRPRIREPSSSSSSNPNPIPRSPSNSSTTGTSIGRTPSITSTTRSPSRTTYTPSIAPSAEGPTSIFATPVGYKPARSLAGLVLTKPSAIVQSKPKESKSGRFSFLSSSKKGNVGGTEKGVTAPDYLVAGPQRSTSNRLLDAALTTSQTWAIRRGEQMMAPSSPAFPSPAGRGGGGGATFAYRPGHQIRREQEAARNAGAGAGGVEADELATRLEAESAITSAGVTGSVFPTVRKPSQSE